MDSDFRFSLPETVPGMTLPDVVLFPQATIPLFIFEPRYRKMLETVLQGDRLMLVATQDQKRAKAGDGFEPYHPNATLGLVQSSQKNPDGTSSILVQGLLRVTAETTFQEDPYRVFGICPVESEPGASAEELRRKSDHLMALVRRRSELGSEVSREMLRFFERIDEPEVLADLVSYTLLDETAAKLRLLGTSEVSARMEALLRILREEIRERELISKLKGGLGDDRISWN